MLWYVPDGVKWLLGWAFLLIEPAIHACKCSLMWPSAFCVREQIQRLVKQILSPLEEYVPTWCHMGLGHAHCFSTPANVFCSGQHCSFVGERVLVMDDTRQNSGLGNICGYSTQLFFILLPSLHTIHVIASKDHEPFNHVLGVRAVILARP